MKKLSLWVLALVVVVAAVGCGKKADPNKPIDQVQAEASKMNAGDLEAMAKAYAKEIESNKGEIEKVKEELKGLAPKDLLGDKGKSIKNDLSEITGEVSELTKRYKIYVDELKAKGGDISGL